MVLDDFGFKKEKDKKNLWKYSVILGLTNWGFSVFILLNEARIQSNNQEFFNDFNDGLSSPYLLIFIAFILVFAFQYILSIFIMIAILLLSFISQSTFRKITQNPFLNVFWLTSSVLGISILTYLVIEIISQILF